jgi:hypothetical protein
MTTTVIPARHVKTCDCCGVECTAENSRDEGTLVITKPARDLDGHAIGSADIRMDLCDSCLFLMAAAVKQHVANTTKHPTTTKE